MNGSFYFNLFKVKIARYLLVNGTVFSLFSFYHFCLLQGEAIVIQYFKNNMWNVKFLPSK